MKAHVLIGCYKGVVEVRASLDENTANNIEKQLCIEYHLPYDLDKRVSAMHNNTDGREVRHYLVKLE